MTRSEWRRGGRKFGFRFLFVGAISLLPFIGCQSGDRQQKKTAAGHEAALTAVLKRNQAIAEYVPSLSEWVKSGSLEGKQIRKPYPTLDEVETRIGKPGETEALALPGKPAKLMTARWYYGSDPDKNNLALEAEFLNEGETWRLNGISFWRGKDGPANTLEYIGRDLMYWKETRSKKR